MHVMFTVSIRQKKCHGTHGSISKFLQKGKWKIIDIQVYEMEMMSLKSAFLGQAGLAPIVEED